MNTKGSGWTANSFLPRVLADFSEFYGLKNVRKMMLSEHHMAIFKIQVSGKFRRQTLTSSINIPKLLTGMDNCMALLIFLMISFIEDKGK